MLMTFPFARQHFGVSDKELSLKRVPVSLKSKSENWPGRFARLDHQHCAPIVCKSRKKRPPPFERVAALVTSAIIGLPIGWQVLGRT